MHLPKWNFRTINISANREMEHIHLNRFNYRLPIKSNLSLFGFIRCFNFVPCIVYLIVSLCVYVLVHWISVEIFIESIRFVFYQQQPHTHTHEHHRQKSLVYDIAAFGNQHKMWFFTLCTRYIYGCVCRNIWLKSFGRSAVTKKTTNKSDTKPQ